MIGCDDPCQPGGAEDSLRWPAKVQCQTRLQLLLQAWITYLVHAPREHRHELVDVVEAVPGPELDAAQVAANAPQTVLGAHVIQAVLPAGVVVVLGPGQRAIIHHKVVPHCGQIEGAVPLPAHLRDQQQLQFKAERETGRGDHLPD